MTKKTKVILKTAGLIVGDIAANLVLGEGINSLFQKAKSVPGKIVAGALGAFAGYANVYAWSKIGEDLGVEIYEAFSESEEDTEVKSPDYDPFEA